MLTGGTGFIGSHLLEELLKLNKKVILIKRSFSNTWRINEFSNNKNLVLKDIDKEDLNDIFCQYDIQGIFHLASFKPRIHKSEDIQNMIDSNINFPTQLLENSMKNNVEFFINTGTVNEYQLTNSPISENTKIKSYNLYAATKTAFESILKFYCNEYNLNCATLKLFTPYGPKDNEMKIAPYVIINSINKKDIYIESPNKKLDFIYIKDVVEAYILLMNNISKFQEYESFNVGTGIGTSIKEFLGIVESNLGKNETVNFGNREDDQVWCSNKKIKEKINWAPKTELSIGIQKTIEYYTQKFND